MTDSMQYKPSMVSRTKPNPISLIPLKAIKWSVDDEYNFLQITEIDNDIFDGIDLSESNLCIFGWDKEPKEFVKVYDLTKKINYPLIVDLKKEQFIDIEKRAYFRIRIFNKATKAIIKDSKQFLMCSVSTSSSLLPMYIKPLGNQIASIEVDEEDGPSLYISSDFKTNKGSINPPKLKSIILKDPVFGCSFWPTAIKAILEKAIEQKNITLPWAQEWLQLVNDMSPSFLKYDGEFLVPEESEEKFKEALKIIVNIWIKKKGFDVNLIKKNDGGQL
tara:strand:- start:8 stop:832 length:825 start_codon:yes stop_codon:yes gene_type:complete